MFLIGLKNDNSMNNDRFVDKMLLFDGEQLFIAKYSFESFVKMSSDHARAVILQKGVLTAVSSFAILFQKILQISSF